MQEIAKMISEKLGMDVLEENIVKLPKNGIDDKGIEIYVARIKDDLIVKVTQYNEFMVYLSSD